MTDQHAAFQRQLEEDQLRPSQQDQLPENGNNATSVVLRSETQALPWWSRWRSPLLLATLAVLFSPLTYVLNREGPVDPTNFSERTRRVLRDTPFVLDAPKQ